MNFKNRIIINWIVLSLVLILSILLYTYNLDFPHWYHADETKKLRFLNSFRNSVLGKHDFHHPLLMIQLGRITNLIYEPFLGTMTSLRLVSVFSGSLILIFSYLISERIRNNKFGWFYILNLCLMPILVIHAHYFKEDMIYTAFSLGSIWAFFKFIDNPNIKNNFILCICLGLTISSQYKGFLLPIIFFLFILIFYKNERKKIVLKNLCFVFFISIILFLVINYPIFFQPKVFLKGVIFQLQHISDGHLIKTRSTDYFFTFHLFKSLMPGMTPLVASFSILSLIYYIRNWFKLLLIEKFFIFYILIFYLIHEISPTKPPPDFMRYMIPIIAPLIFLNCKLVFKILEKNKYLGLILAITLLVGPLIESILLTKNLKHDTRELAADYFIKYKSKIIGEKYTQQFPEVRSLVRKPISEYQNDGIRYLVASSFEYQRFIDTIENHTQQNEVVHEYYQTYINLFKYPYIEIKPRYKSFAFSNPIIRIIDITK